MYEYISGKIAEISPVNVVIDNGGIGYSINISLQTFTALGAAESAKIYTYQYLVRDDLPVLYGFFTKSEREMFKLLIGVSGIGAGSARMVLSTFSIADLVSIISTGNSSMLKSVKGLGAKTSEKVIVELRDKVLSLDVEGSQTTETVKVDDFDMEVFEEAVSALTMLGFSKIASTKAVKTALKNGENHKVEDIIRISLKNM